MTSYALKTRHLHINSKMNLQAFAGTTETAVVEDLMNWIST